MRSGLVTTHIKALCYFVPANWGMVTVLEMFYFAIGALCIGDFSNCEHGKTRAEDLQVPQEFHSYWPFLSLNPSSSVRDKPHCSSRSSAPFLWALECQRVAVRQRPKAGPAQCCAGWRFVLSC